MLPVPKTAMPTAWWPNARWPVVHWSGGCRKACSGLSSPAPLLPGGWARGGGGACRRINNGSAGTCTCAHKPQGAQPGKGHVDPDTVGRQGALWETCTCAHSPGGGGGCYALSPKNCDGHCQKGRMVAECSVASGLVVWRVPLGPLGAAFPRVVGDRRLGPVSSPRLPQNWEAPRGPCHSLG